MSDIVNHPDHYTHGKYEVVDIIEDTVADPISYHLATILKYILRARFKGTMLQDCKKARWHIDRMIGIMESNESGKTRENTG